MVQLLWGTVWQLLKRLNIDLPRDPATPTPKNITKINENMCAQKNFYVILITALLILSKKVETTHNDHQQHR